MEIKTIDSLDISECLRLLKIDETRLKTEGLEYLNGLSGADAAVVARLKKLLEEESEAFNRCVTISDYEDYLSAWPDGIYRTEAESRVAGYVAAKAETDFFEKNATTIKGLRFYLKFYPDGVYAKTARQMLVEKGRRQQRCMRTIVAVVIMVVVFILCVTTCHPATRLYISADEVVIGKRGGAETLTVSTFALKRNISVLAADYWIDEELSGSSLTLDVRENVYGQRTGKVKVYAYSTVLGLRYSKLMKEVTVIQQSGLPTFLDIKYDDRDYSKYKWGKTFTVCTDGCELEITTDKDSSEWYYMRKDIEEGAENTMAKVTVTMNRRALDGERFKKDSIMVRSGDKYDVVYVYYDHGRFFIDSNGRHDIDSMRRYGKEKYYLQPLVDER